MHVEIIEFFKHMIYNFLQVVDRNNKLLVFFSFGHCSLLIEL